MSDMWRDVEAQPIKVTPPSPPLEGPGAFWAMVREDMEAVLANDPAARGSLEVLTTYPGLHALWLHRLAHGFWNRGKFTCARLLSHFGRQCTGVEIHPGAQLGRRVFIDHGMGVVVGETAIIGDACLIYKGVVLGGTSLERTKRHPTLGHGVVVGSNACILGNLAVGDGARVGSGSVVIRDVPDGATVVGVPGRIVSTTHGHNPLDHGDLPDPVATLVRSLLDQVDRLQGRVETLEAFEAVARGVMQGSDALPSVGSQGAPGEEDPRAQLNAVFSEELE